MALVFRRVSSAPLVEFDAAAPDGAVIGVVGENGAGKSVLARLAGGVEQPITGVVDSPGGARLLGPDSPLNLAPAPVLAIDHTFARQDLLVRERAAVAIDRLRQAGSTILLISHEDELLRRLADEVWWLHEGKLAGRGDPEEILCAYRRHISQRVRAWGGTMSAPISPRFFRGDGRAEIVGVELTGEDGKPTMVWRAGEPVAVKVTVKYQAMVAQPVVGMLIRTRSGFNVYGTNTEMERLRLGPVRAGGTLAVRFQFRCDLCPQEYTLTVASHDPDGVWHEWLEDAVAFLVTDSRYTAGVANLRAQVSLAKDE
ncbi:MAG: Wzt carbohydrate-binding domain-containing protein [Bryobacteraceae bacterium]|jgi:lipopolysaccharide transport system ATP-binding protein